MSAIVIPAHNEGAVIAATLTALLPQLEVDDEVVVVANGCSDDTAARAAVFAPRVRVESIAEASKVAALNRGDSVVSRFPRIYMDADIRLGEGTLAALKQALRGPGAPLAVSPVPVMDFSGCGWAVRAYYRVWLNLPYCRHGMIGCGVYALSRRARDRFERFPDIVADDGYVRRLFREGERAAAPGALAIVRAPATLGWLIRIKLRSRFGNAQLDARYPHLRANEVKPYRSALRALLADPHEWPALGVYLYVVAVTRAAAWFAHRRRDRLPWLRDLSRREASGDGLRELRL